MKNFLLRTSLLVLLCAAWSVLCGHAQALTELKQGKAYRFLNVGQPSYALAAGTTAIGLTATSGCTEAEYNQLWVVADITTLNGVNQYRLRNMGSGLYLQADKNASTKWQMVSDPNAAYTQLYLVTLGGTHNSLSLQNNTNANNYQTMHLDNGQDVVCWYGDNQSSQWDIVEQPIDEATIEANWKSLEGTMYTQAQIESMQAALETLFADMACTTLRPTYAQMTQGALTADGNYTKLPAALQQMVLKTWKTQNGTPLTEAWREDNFDASKPAWDGDYARRFRIQNYEVYTERDCTNQALKVNIHTNLNNPTGIFGNKRQALFIMVDQDVPANASLYFGTYQGHGQAGNYNDGVALHKGLNVVATWEDKTWSCIYYTAKTMKAWDGRTNLADFSLADFPDLTIHIEGGNVNGFYNAVGDDRWAHNAATTGCDSGHNLSTLATTLTKADGTQTAPNDNLLQSNNVYPKGDNEGDWDYYAARNVLDDLTILGRYQTIQFSFNPPAGSSASHCTNYWFTTQNGSRRVRITDWLERWDRIMMSERLVLGVLSREEVEEANARYHAWDATKHDIFSYTGDDAEWGVDYSKHYRLHGLAISTTDPGTYMSGGWTSANYNNNTLPDIIGKMNDESSAGGVLWGPAHEMGHQHQQLLNMRGLTEVSNNMFSNVAVWYDGRGTSRTNAGQGDLSYVLEAYNTDGHDFFTNNIWAQTQMFYKLWLYYHLVGKNTNFVPRLIEMLRRDPMVIQYDQQGSTSLLHFYKKSCEAAGEDLTEFFRAHGFFEVMDKRFVGDYSNAEYTQTQADIDEAINYIKAKGYPENRQIIFINDNAQRATYLKHDGVTARKLWDGKAFADLGSYTAYQNASESPVSGTYSLTVNNNEVSLTGAEGGVGFLIYDEDGKLLAFSNDYTFPVSEATTAALAAGKATVLAITGSGETIEVGVDNAGATESLLKAALEKARELLTHVDDGGTSGNDYTRVGFYRQDEVAALLTAYNEALAIYNGNLTASYLTVYEALNSAYTDVMANSHAQVTLLPGSACVLANYAYSERYMAEDASGNVITNTQSGGVNSSTVPANGQWIFEEAGEANVYYLKNANSGQYAQALTRSTVLKTGSTPVGYTLHTIGTGLFSLRYNGAASNTLHSAAGVSYKVVGWDDNEDPSQWYITMVSKDEVSELRQEVAALAEKTQQLIDQMATVSPKGAQDMSGFVLSSNAPEPGHGPNLAVDGNTGTFFHTAWYGSAVNEDHYLLIDCGEGLSLGDFTLNYYTLPVSAYNVDAPTVMVIEGSNHTGSDGLPADFTEIATLTSNDATPLPTAKNQYYTSGVLGNGEDYRFIRLRVTQTTGGLFGTHYYFGLAELGIYRMENAVHNIDGRFTTLTKDDVMGALDEVQCAKLLLDDSTTTLSILQTEYNALNLIYSYLLDIYNEGKDNPIITQIGQTAGSQPQAPVIYDMQGRRLNRIVQPGIYLINGQKKWVRTL